uniref:Perforin n=1 Tax=Leptobrachium leishanense TaxID=445787 RepID=A0A8C5Q0P6_9ANUR
YYFQAFSCIFFLKRLLKAPLILPLFGGWSTFPSGVQRLVRVVQWSVWRFACCVCRVCGGIRRVDLAHSRDPAVNAEFTAVSQNPSLIHYFKESVKSLPESYSVKTKYEYLQFIKRYGTHYISQADVGSEVVEVTAIKTCQVALQGASVEELKDCLNIETNVAVTGKVEANAKASACRELSQKMTRQNNFHQTFNERTWQVRGGSIKFDLLSINNKDNNAAEFETWMESLKKDPDIVTYSLEPVHDLLKSELKENLQKAVSEYIMEKPSEGAKCTCFCPRSEFLTPSCCPAKKGLAKLVVTIRSGSGLWGDYISKTDSYVKVNIGTKTFKTGTIWNNDNPVWNTSFDINPADLELITSIDIEVWDVDSGYDDDRLGSCKKTLTSGDKSDVCHLDHGTLNYKVRVECMQHLVGEHCQEYAPSNP